MLGPVQIAQIMSHPWSIQATAFDGLLQQGSSDFACGATAFGRVDLTPTAAAEFSVRGGLARYDVRGVLVPGSYQTLVATVRAMAGSAATRILVSFDTPGGSLLGLEEASAAIRSLRGRKPMEAVVDGMATHAGYHLASAFDAVYAGPSSSVGGIGAEFIHASYQGLLADQGVKVTPVHFGQNKVDGSPLLDLNKQSRATLQEFVDSYGQLFIAGIARNRGISASAVETSYGQGKIFIASEALWRGLVDGIATVEQRLAAK